MPWLVAVAVTVVVVGVGQAGAPLTPADGRAMEDALDRILSNAATAHTRRAPTSVSIEQRSLNGWFRFQGAGALPPGVADPELTFEEAGRLIARATVDLDDLREEQPERSLFDPLRYLSGDVSVSAAGRVQASDGTIRVDVESVEIGEVPVPTTMMYELVRYYTRSDSQPDGIDLRQTFRLPHSIEAVRIEPRRIVVVQ